MNYFFPIKAYSIKKAAEIVGFDLLVSRLDPYKAGTIKMSF